MRRSPTHAATPSADIRRALGQSREALVGVGLFSCLINILALTGSIYMLQVYDRVLPSHSVPTLVALSAILVLFYAASGMLDVIRTRLLARVGLRLDRSLRSKVYDALLLLSLRSGRSGKTPQPVRDLDQIRAFLSGAGPVAFFDLPWMPVYLCLVYLLHPWLGYLAFGGGILMVGLTLLTDALTRAPSGKAAASAGARQSFVEVTRDSAEAIRALGMGRRMAAAWSRINEDHLAHQLRTTDVASTYASISKVFRMLLQSLVLGVGAYLVIQGECSGGVMIAASIMTSRALAPVEIAIANWKGFVGARESMKRLSMLLKAMPDDREIMPLPAPCHDFDVSDLWAAPPGQQKAILQNVSFSLMAGDGLGIIGPSAAGKSTLARALVGAWQLQRGKVRMDGASLDQWDPDALGQHIGYLPQDIELHDGSVRENIARFDPNAKSEAVIDAARQAGIHDMVLRLPQGYETRIGTGGHLLSAGQRQRVALARALYGNPFLIVMDEPNSNLDAEGDAALSRAIAAARARGGIVIVVAHRPAVLANLDKVLFLNEGLVQAFGRKEDVMQQILAPAGASAKAPPPRAVAEAAE